MVSCVVNNRRTQQGPSTGRPATVEIRRRFFWNHRFMIAANVRREVAPNKQAVRGEFL
jgi:hypothetical protein